MFLFGKSKHTEQSVLLCVIESGAVHAALCLMRPKSKPLLVHVATHTIPFQDSFDFDRFARTTLQALAQSCADVMAKGIPHVSSRRVRSGHIDAVYCTYGSPWYVAQTQHVNVHLKKPVGITQKTLDALIAEHADATLSVPLAQQGDAPRILEHHIVDIRLNGYALKNPFGKTADRISFSIISGGVSSAFSKLVEDVVSRYVVTNRIVHHAGIATLFFGTRDALAVGESFLLVDISAELTDIALVRNGILQETISFPVGIRTLMRSFAHQTRLMPQEVPGALRALGSDALASSRASALQKAATATRTEWIDACTRALIQVLARAPLPQQAYICGDSDAFLYARDVLIPTALTHPQSASDITSTVVLAEHYRSACLARSGVRLAHPLVPCSALHVHTLLTMQKP